MRNPIGRIAAIACIMTQMACGSKHITLERNIDLQSVVLTKYAESGFLVTPHGYGGDYDALAFIQIEGKDRVVVVTNGWSGQVRRTYSTDGPVTLNDVLEAAVFIAKEIGGDAITGIQWSFGTLDYYNSWPISRDNVQLSGWAIKRADRETDGGA